MSSKKIWDKISLIKGGNGGIKGRINWESSIFLWEVVRGTGVNPNLRPKKR